MTTTKNFRTILTSLGVPVLFSFSLMLAALISIAPIFLEDERLTYGVFGSVIALVITFLFLKLDKKSWGDYLLSPNKKTLLRFAIGSGTGLALASIMFLSQAWFSGLDISFTNATIGQFLWFSLSLIPLAFMEELAFRSYAFIKLKQTYGIWIAQISISILFALYHYIGGWSLTASILGPGVWSFAFGLLALKSNGISLPTGFHFGLNLALAVIGNKYWIPGLINLEFADTPTEAMLKSNEYFGGVLQLAVFAVLIILTYRYNRNIHGKKKLN